MKLISGALVSAIEGPKVDRIGLLIWPVPGLPDLSTSLAQEGHPVISKNLCLVGILRLHHEGQRGVRTLEPQGIPEIQEALDIGKDKCAFVGAFDHPVDLGTVGVDREVYETKGIGGHIRPIRHPKQQTGACFVEDYAIGVQLEFPKEAVPPIDCKGVLYELVESGMNRRLAEPVRTQCDVIGHSFEAPQSTPPGLPVHEAMRGAMCFVPEGLTAHLAGDIAVISQL
jgi:hypothetical protein